jgi:ferrochelatase
MGPTKCDAVMLIAFGGPGSPEEIRPFLARVTQGIPIPPERLEAVAHHYHAVGGKSPLNEITFRQAAALENALALAGAKLPVYVGLRNSAPSFSETLEKMGRDGAKRALGFILSAHRSEASWERYKKNIDAARAELSGNAPAIDYCAGWHDHPLFIQTWRESITRVRANLSASESASAPLVFTAHSLPVTMAARSSYVAEVEASARMIAGSLRLQHWSVAYQSRSGNPAEPWLEPDISRAIADLAAGGARAAVVAPIGFVADHVEVLYDLDIEAQNRAEQLGLRLVRASCPNDNPTFIAMIADVIKKHLSAAAIPE